jgi:hypothetical protein
VRFEIAHDFDVSVRALELAVVSPDLVGAFCAKVRALGVGIEAIQERSRSMRGDVLERVWHYQANVSIPAFARPYVTREMCSWEEHATYALSEHQGLWTIVPNVKPEWRKYVSSSGTYRVDARGDGRCRRVIQGQFELRVGVFRVVAERLVLAEVKKAFGAEAATLADMAILA